MNGSKLHDYQGPHDISEKTHRHVNRRAVERKHRMENMNAETFQKSSEITQEEHDKLLKEIEPPWSWMHQFATLNCRDKSHNFLELQSIASDETPAESSDESFDFENNRFYEADEIDKVSEISDNRSLVDMLLLDEVPVDSRPAEHSALDVVNITGLINDIIDSVQLAVANKKVELQNTASIRSFLSDKVVDGRKLSTLDLRAVQRAIKNADDSKVVFKTFADLEEYLRKEMNLPESEKPSVSLELKIESKLEPPSIPASMSKIPETTDENLQPESGNIDVALIAQPKPLESQFDDCQIEIDEKAMNKAVPDMMLGLIATPPATPIIIPTPPRTPTPTPPSPYDTSSGIISANVSHHDFPPTLQPLVFLPPPPKPDKEPFACRVPPMPGIGPSVSKETIRNVLTFLKSRSRNENGLVYPRHFLEAKCPNIVETYEG